MTSWSRWARCFILAMSCALMAACAEETPEADVELEELPEEVLVSIGEKGGTVKAKGVTLTIPQGALDKEVMISAKVISTDKVQIPTHTKDVSAVYEFGPKGTQFAKPIQVQIATEKDEPSAKMFFTKDGDETQFEQLASVSKDKSVTASTKHFSLAFVGIPNDAAVPDANGDTDAGTGGEPTMDAGTETPDIDPTRDAEAAAGDEDGSVLGSHDGGTLNPGENDASTGSEPDAAANPPPSDAAVVDIGDAASGDSGDSGSGAGSWDGGDESGGDGDGDGDGKTDGGSIPVQAQLITKPRSLTARLSPA